MTRRFTRLAWTAATFTYLLIILGAIVRITGSGLGCGEHWPLCNGKLLPPLDLPTLNRVWTPPRRRRVSGLVAALAAYAWWLRRGAPTDPHQPPQSSTASTARGGGVRRADVAPPSSRAGSRDREAEPAALDRDPSSRDGDAAACHVDLDREQRSEKPRPCGPGYTPSPSASSPSSSARSRQSGGGQRVSGISVVQRSIHPGGELSAAAPLTHRLLAYTLFAYVVWWAVRSKRPGPWYVVALVTLQVAVAAAMVLSGLPQPLQAAHVAMGRGRVGRTGPGRALKGTLKPGSFVLWVGRVYLGALRVDVHVDLAAHAEALGR